MYAGETVKTLQCLKSLCGGSTGCFSNGFLNLLCSRWVGAQWNIWI